MDATSLPPLPAGFRYTNRTIVTVVRQFGITGPICHVGSLLHDKEGGTAERWREVFDKQGLKPFIGIDLFEGPNVDLQADLCDPAIFDRHPDLEGRFNLVFCSALLEHVADLFTCAKVIRRLIAPGGYLYFSGPWAAGYHAYPDDYWRISFSGLKVLFPDLEWLLKWYAGTNKGVTIDFDDATLERKLFTFDSQSARARMSDRSISYIMVSGLGRAPL
jgi:hypothetical protein